MSRHTDHRLRTICEVCKQWVRVKAQGRSDVVRHHSRPQGQYCSGSGAPIIWTVPRSERTRGRPGAGEESE